MKSKNYDREISLICPTCGESQFIYDVGEKIENMVFQCHSCKQKFSRDDLIRENGEIIDEIISEIKDEIIRDATEELRKALKKGFK